MEGKILPKLRVSKEEAYQQIEAQIEKGRQLHVQQISAKDDLNRMSRESNNWSKYNIYLLTKIFDNSAMAMEYEDFNYNPPDISELEYLAYQANITSYLQSKIDEYRTGISDSINSLQLILKLLKLCDGPSDTDLSTVGNEIFIVHGRDDGIKETVARFVEKLGLKATILHEQPSGGQTIIEKLEKYADNAGFAIVLLTPDDIGSLKDEIENEDKPRARQNVVFELGYFMGRLGRQRICPIFKGKIEKPSDIDGVIYVSMDGENWKLKLGQEIKNAGFPVDMNKIF